MKTRSWLIASALLVACAHTEAGFNFAAQEDYSLDVFNDTSSQVFRLRLRAVDKRLCIGRDEWPNSRGQLHMGSQLAYVASATGTYRAKDSNFGYCSGDSCTIAIQPNQTLTGFISYDEFPGWDWNSDAENGQLNFSVQPRIC